MKVLLVEDEYSMLYTLSNILKHRGHQVIAAPSAEKGLEALGEDQVDLVISDLRLPGMDGISLIARVREQCEDVVPIIITAYGTLENAIDALKLSVYDFLRKPFDLSSFEETISRAEQRRHQLLSSRRLGEVFRENPAGESRKRQILSRFVSQRIMERIISGKEGQTQMSPPQKVSVLFADISDFTGLSERLDQKSLVFIVNRFYSALEPIMDQYEGILDKFMGDGIMMVFGDSESQKVAACRAVAAAIQIQWHTGEIYQKQTKLPEINIHIGISTGMASACRIGTENYVNYTYIGDAVNLAKRLQELAQPGEIIVSQATAADLKRNPDLIPSLKRLVLLPPQFIKGREEKMLVYRAEYARGSHNSCLPGC